MLAPSLKRTPDSNSFAIFQDLNHTPKRLPPTPEQRPLSAGLESDKHSPAPPLKETSNKYKHVHKRRNSLPSATSYTKVNVPRLPPKNATRMPESHGTPEPTAAPIDGPPLSLWDYLQIELTATDSDEAHEFKRERVKNFLMLPEALERTLWFGFVVCLDSFLYIFTILPMRLFRSLYHLGRRMSKAQVSLKSSEKVDILKSALILLTCIILNQLDASRIYHNIRGQAAIKLYVLYNVLTVGDKLFCALGQDILDCLFSKSTFGKKEDGTQRHLRPLAFFLLALVYNVMHTILLFYQVVTLNVTVNSFSNALMTLLLSNQFVEIKGSVFKKFEKEGLFQITCADMVERFQLFIMLLIIGLRNTFEISPSSISGVIGTTLGPMITVLGSEILVDWLKHAFITKFNHVRPTIYARFTDVLCRDYVNAGTDAYVDQSPAISRRIGLPVLPLVCLTIRSSSQLLTMMEPTYTTYLVLLLMLSSLCGFKLWLGVSIIRFAHHRYHTIAAREVAERTLEDERNSKNVYKGVVEVDGHTKALLNDVKDNLGSSDQKRTLYQVERYSMISKRIW